MSFVEEKEVTIKVFLLDTASLEQVLVDMGVRCSVILDNPGQMHFLSLLIFYVQPILSLLPAMLKYQTCFIRLNLKYKIWFNHDTLLLNVLLYK